MIVMNPFNTKDTKFEAPTVQGLSLVSFVTFVFDRVWRRCLN
jgi:hypothetical protein